MQKTLKKALALLLALLMLIGGMAVTATANARTESETPQRISLREEPRKEMNLAQSEGSISLQSQPTFKIIEMPDCNFTIATVECDCHWGGWHWEFDFAGLVLEFSGGRLAEPVLATWDDIRFDPGRSPAVGLIEWEWDIWGSQWAAGENNAFFELWGWRYTEFVPVIEHEGEWFGYFNSEYIGYAETRITINIVDDADVFSGGGGRPNFETAKPLPLNTATPVSLEPWTPESENWVRESALFKFTAPADGYYRFRSTGAKPGGWLFSEAGDRVYIPGVDPFVETYLEDGSYAGGDDDSGGELNFRRTAYLKSGESIYLNVSAHRGGDFSIIAETVEIKFVNISYRVNFHDWIDFDAILEGTGFTRHDIRILIMCPTIIRWWYSQPHAYNRGSGPLLLESLDGNTIISVDITVGYSFAQWLCVIFLGGWIWMPYTLIGPFNLMENIQELMAWGVGYSILNLLIDWVTELRWWLMDLRWQWFY